MPDPLHVLVFDEVLRNHAYKHRPPLSGTHRLPSASQHAFCMAHFGPQLHQAKETTTFFSAWSTDDTQPCFDSASLFPHKLFSMCIKHVDKQDLINSHTQTPQTPGDPINVYSGSKTQLWSSHLPQLLCPAFDPQGLADSCCVASAHVKAKSSRNMFYQCSVPAGPPEISVAEYFGQRIS